jgi:gluconolactonase
MPRPTDAPGATGAAVRVLAEGLDHPEGVAWDPDRGRVICGGEAGQLYAVDLESGAADLLATTTGLVLGVAVDGAGRMVACIGDEGEVRVWDGDAFRTVLREVDGERLSLPNYPAFGLDGTLYVSDSGGWHADRGRIVALGPDGRAWTVTRARERFTNGLAVSADGAWLYVAESEGDEKGPRVSRLPLPAGGGAEVDPPVETLATFPGTVLDGLAVVADGSLVVTCYRPDRVYHLGLDGRTTLIAEDWQGTALAGVTNAAFAGTGLDTLVVANLNRWHLAAVEAGLVGAPLHRPRVWALDQGAGH